QNPEVYARRGEAAALLDPTRSECGSDEGRAGNERYFWILCSPNPQTYDATSWIHEGWHLIQGHTALRYTLGVPLKWTDPVGKIALNTFLDYAYVWPTIVLGGRSSAWLRAVVLLLALGLRFRRRLTKL